MRKLKKSLLILFSIIAITAFGFYIYLLSTKPQYEGEISIKNIAKETTVYFDDYGIPHIYANNQKDAMTVLGYVHAQDRLWQMELMRRIAPGRLSELFGTKALKSDQFFSGVGIDENSQKAISQLDKSSTSYKMALAYLDGINQYLKNGKTPIEFTILGIKKEKFTLKDVYNTFGFMAFSFAMAQKTDPILTEVRDKLGEPYLKDFGLEETLKSTQILNYKGKINEYSEISKTITSLLDNTLVPPFIGSNSWVIGSQKTKNKKVILANDPHIAFSQPCTWYEAHITCDNYEMYGYYLAGTPFPLLGHNRQYAYGLTMLVNDDIDLFIEETNPANPKQYKTLDGYKNYTIRKKTIKVKDSASVSFEIKESIHGPIMNDLLNTTSIKKPLAMYWIYTQQKNQILDAVYSLSHATSYSDFNKGVALIAAPGLNVMYGDAQNNVAWTAAGKLYKQDKTVNPNFILNGSNGIDDKKEFLDFSKNPSAINPPWHYVYSANNQPQAVDGFLYPGYYVPQDRAKRITTLLETKNNWTKEEVSTMINDNVSTSSPENVQSILSAINVEKLTKTQKSAFQILKKWNGSNDLKDIAPTIYNKLLYCYIKNTFKDELDNDNFNLFTETLTFKRAIPNQIKNKNSIWWDNVNTKNINETRTQILHKSFLEAISLLENQLGKDHTTWTWNKVHTLEHQHPMGKVKGLRSFFNVGKFEVPGSNEVINNLKFTIEESGNYEVKAGPSTRRIIDFSDIENSWSILPTGNSGNPMSKHYNDQAQMYITGKFRKMKMNKNEIITTSTKLVFKPK